VTDSFGAGNYDFWLVKTDSAGNIQWNQTYGGGHIDQEKSLVKTGDGGYIAAGWTRSFGAGIYDGWLIKVDSHGNMQWSKTIGGTKAEGIYCVVETNDGGYATAGWTSVFYEDNRTNFWLVKTDVEGEFGLAWTDSTDDTITLYRGITDLYWNYVRVRIWKIKETP